ncbi:MAG: magnesium transporter [Planctomycetota bacterium]
MSASDELTLEERGPTALDDVRSWIAAGNSAELAAWLRASDAADVIYTAAQLTDQEREGLLSTLRPDQAADLFELLPEPQRIEALQSMEPGDAAAIVHELASDDQADIISEVENAEEILAALDPEEAAVIRGLADYEWNTAGGLMIAEFFAFPKDLRVGEIVSRLQDAADNGDDYDVQYVYVVDDDSKLAGVLRLRDLLLSPRGRPAEALMLRDPHSVHVDDTLEQLVAFFNDHGFFGAPVLDDEGRLLGVVRASAVREATTERSDSDYSKSQGIVGGEELRSMPLRIRCTRRLSWLSLNIVLNVAAASIIALHQETLEAVIALAVFLPIISDMSGCSGNQAVAVSMRELSLNVARPRDWLRVWRKESLVGIINGLALGLLIGVVAILWQGSPALGVVVGGALALNTVVAVSIGGVVPLLLKGLKLDPALASGPILTTVTDMCGFLLVLSFASYAMDYLR